VATNADALCPFLSLLPCFSLRRALVCACWLQSARTMFDDACEKGKMKVKRETG